MTRAFGRRDILQAFASRGHAASASSREGRTIPRSLPEKIVDAMNAIFGKHPGFRSAHAKGVVCEGEFMPAATAPGLSKAAQRLAFGVRRESSYARAPDRLPEASAPAGVWKR